MSHPKTESTMRLAVRGHWLGLHLRINARQNSRRCAASRASHGGIMLLPLTGGGAVRCRGRVERRASLGSPSYGKIAIRKPYYQFCGRSSNNDNRYRPIVGLVCILCPALLLVTENFPACCGEGLQCLSHLEFRPQSLGDIEAIH